MKALPEQTGLSSPQAQEALERHRSPSCLTPAGARTLKRAPPAVLTPHPCGRRQHGPAGARRMSRPLSSPQARGRRGRERRLPGGWRFIPAGAVYALPHIPARKAAQRIPEHATADRDRVAESARGSSRRHPDNSRPKSRACWRTAPMGRNSTRFGKNTGRHRQGSCNGRSSRAAGNLLRSGGAGSGRSVARAAVCRILSHPHQRAQPVTAA